MLLVFRNPRDLDQVSEAPTWKGSTGWFKLSFLVRKNWPPLCKKKWL